MSHAPRRLAASVAFLLVAAVATVPLASASGPEPTAPQLPCPTLPLWDATWCWVGVTIDIVNREYQWLTCEIIGGPVCGLNVCEDTNICTTTTE